jgi:flagellar hook protein FlgE
LNGSYCAWILLGSCFLAGCGGAATDSTVFPPSGGDPPTGASTNPSTAIAGSGTTPASAAPLNTGTDTGTALPVATCVKPTTRVDIAANLDASAKLITRQWSPADPFANTNYVSMATIFDSLGRAHELAVTFRKVATNAFEYHALVDAYAGVWNLDGGTEVSAGVLSFLDNGALSKVTTTNVATVRFEGSAASGPIAVGFGESLAEGGSGLDGTISVSAAFLVVGQWQDGSACGGEASEQRPCAWPLDGQGLLGSLALDSSICE